MLNEKMEIEFDKEMDALLRQAAKPESAAQNSAPHSHLDADEISVFAENALPAKVRERAVAHLADCARCRTVLANFIALNAETNDEKIREKQKKSAAAASPAAPWYRKLFALPKTVYAFGALALIFSGIVVFTVLQNADRNASTQVAQISEKNAAERKINSSANAALTAADSPNNAAPVAAGNKSSASVNSPAVKKNAPAGVINSAAAREVEKSEPAKPKSAVTPVEKDSADADKKEDSMPSAAAPPAAAKPKNSQSNDSENSAVSGQDEPSQNSAQNQTSAPNAPNARLAAPMRRRAEMKVESTPTGGAQNEDRAAETRTVAGKNFRRSGGVWYDANYNGQPTTNIARGSNAYRNLDANLRAIAEKLNGALVVVQNGKAYRIQ